MNRPRRAGIALAVLLLAAAGTARAQNGLVRAKTARAAEIIRDTIYDDAVIKLDLENGPSEVVPALVYDTILLVPVRQVFEMAGVRLAAFAALDSAVIMLEPGNVPVLFRPAVHLLLRGALALPHDSLEVAWSEGELFISTGLVDRLLGTRTAIDWQHLSVMMGNTAGLPAMQRARRERRHALLGASQAAPGVLEMRLAEHTFDGVVGTWAVTASTSGPTDRLGLDLGLGGGVAGGSAEIREMTWTNRGLTGSEFRASWSRVLSSPYARQIQFGDVPSQGRRSRLMRGAVVTNAPFIRSSEFDTEDLTGRAAPGWEIELYDRGRLLAFTEANQLGAFRVPLELRYGQNPFELVMYGPGGETVRQRRTIRVPFSRVPAGRMEYTLAAGACRYDPCSGMMSADARYGLNNRMTVQGGWEGFFGSEGGTLWQPYAVLSTAPLNDLGVTGEAVANGLMRLTADYEPTIDLRVNAGITKNAGQGAQFGARPNESTLSDGSLYWRPGWMSGDLFFQGSGALSSGASFRRRLVRLAATTRLGALRYSLGFLSDVQTHAGTRGPNRFAIDAGADAIVRGPWPWLARSIASGQIAIEPSHGLTAIRATIGRRIARTIRADAGLGWFKGAGASLELGFSTSGAGPRMSTRSRINSQTGTDALMTANGSLALDPRSRLLRVSDAEGLGRAGVSGVLFRDDNANGRRDRGEPPLPGIPILVGGRQATTDQNGHFAAWGLFPFEPVRIAVDSLAFENPQLMLPAPVIVVRPVPNTFAAVEVPVVVGGEVSGYVVFGDEPIGGVPVVLRELNTGAEVTTLTYVDGVFYRSAVPPGEYEVTLPEEVLERLGAVAPPMSIFIPPGAGEKRFMDLHLRLERRP